MSATVTDAARMAMVEAWAAHLARISGGCRVVALFYVELASPPPGEVALRCVRAPHGEGSHETLTPDGRPCLFPGVSPR